MERPELFQITERESTECCIGKALAWYVQPLIPVSQRKFWLALKKTS